MRRNRQFTAEQKAAVLKRHHVEKMPVSQVCEEFGLQPSVFYAWQKQFFENADKAVAATKGAQSTSTREKQLEATIATLQAKLARKDSVIAEISEEYTNLKKNLGSPDRSLGSP